MSIKWFPGHMITARKKAAETMRMIDLVIEVLDARVPRSSCNPTFEELRHGGAAARAQAAQQVRHGRSGADAALAAALQRPAGRAGPRAVREEAAARSSASCRPVGRCDPIAARPDKPLRMMILGIPNVGKSTFMNALLKRHVAHVGDEPAITKVQMLHKLGPGMTPRRHARDVVARDGAGHGLEARRDPQHRAGGVRRRRRRAAASVSRCCGDIPRCSRRGSARFPGPATSTACWRSSPRADTSSRSRQGPDLARAAAALLNDFRSGALGRITPRDRRRVVKNERHRRRSAACGLVVY